MIRVTHQLDAEDFHVLARAANPIGAEVMWEKAERLHNRYFTITLDLPHRPRTTGWKSQNHRFNGFISQFCESTGNDFADIKLFVKRRAMRKGLPPMTNASGNIVYSKVDGEPLPKSETDMSIEECSWCISEIEQLGAEMGIVFIEVDNNGLILKED